MKKIRTILAGLNIFIITLIFLDFTGAVLHVFGFLTEIQFLPKLISLNIAAVFIWLLITILFGRVYCSVVCPLGIFQDIVSRIGRKFGQKPGGYKPSIPSVRYTFLGITFIGLVTGLSFVSLLEPYSAYGRMVTNFLSPLYNFGNNLLYSLFESDDLSSFYSVKILFTGLVAHIIAFATLLLVGIMAFKKGRLYCNTICPVGTFLGLFSRFAAIAPRINENKCKKCKKCSNICKANCIQIEKDNISIDTNRCVMCFDCLDQCDFKALYYGGVLREEDYETTGIIGIADYMPPVKDMPNTDDSNTIDNPEDSNKPVSESKETNETDKSLETNKIDESAQVSRRSFISTAAQTSALFMLASSSAMADDPQEAMSPIGRKEPTKRATPICPPGSESYYNFKRSCTACMLCVSKCPNHVLTPLPGDLKHLSRPVMSFEHGFCRPECTLCSQICPTDAIKPIKREERTSLQIGIAHWNKDRCLIFKDNVHCGLCAKRCPAGAITMIEQKDGKKIPSVNHERCIGCGACEYYCPARPSGAIVVEGSLKHRNL